MAAKKAKKPKKSDKPPEGVIGGIKAGGKLVIETDKLEKFLKTLKKKKPKVEFVARNAPFMRQAPIPPV